MCGVDEDEVEITDDESDAHSSDEDGTDEGRWRVTGSWRERGSGSDGGSLASHIDRHRESGMLLRFGDNGVACGHRTQRYRALRGSAVPLARGRRS